MGKQWITVAIDEEVELDVYGDYFKGEQSDGVTPPDPASFEVIHIKYRGQRVTNLAKACDLFEKIDQTINENLDKYFDS